jgi:cysteinyl-tRNA synthetase
MQKKNEIHSALCDNFDTPHVMRNLQDLVKKINIHMELPDEKSDITCGKFLLYIKNRMVL